MGKFLRAIATVGGLTMVSRVVGLARDLLIAGLLGAGPIADAFFVALKLPNFFRRWVGEGAFSVSFVPLFSRKLETEGHDSAKRFAEEAQAMLMAILLPATLLMIVCMPYVISGLAPGFVDDPDRFYPAVEMARITFPYLIMVTLVAMMGGMLNAIGKFMPFAAAPILFNLGLIGGLLFLRDYVPTGGHALAVGLLLAGTAQVTWMTLCCLGAKLTLKTRLPRLTPDVKRLFALMGPGMIGAGVMQINVFVDMILASLLPAGSVSYLYYGDRLSQLPLGVIGIAVGTALLPMLARALQANRTEDATTLFSRALEVALLLGLPAMVALVVIPVPILTVLFQHGEFHASDTQATALALAAYAAGIPANLLNKVLTTGFYAREDTKTPLLIAVITAGSNIALGLTLIWPLQHMGLALATALASWIMTAVSAFLLHRRGILHVAPDFASRTIRIVLSAVWMGGALYGGMIYAEPWLQGPLLHQGLALAALVGGGMVSYVVFALLTRAARPREMLALFKKSET